MQAEAIDIKRVAQDAGRWLTDSGIQSREGGFYAWYDSDKAQYSYLYSEITGYGITSLLFLNRMTGNALLVEKAKLAASWIIKEAVSGSRGVRTRLYDNDNAADRTYSFSAGKIFSFDTGMVLYGIVSLYKVTSDKRFLEISKALADFLLDRMRNSDGSLAAVYDAGKSSPDAPAYDKWSNQSGAFHAKVSMALAELFKITKNEKYKNGAIGLCGYALKKQDSSGRFITDIKTGSTNMHPHCYAAEGLFYSGKAFDMPEFVEASKKAAEWITSHITPDGIRELYDPEMKNFTGEKRSDILAQALRLGLIHSLDDPIDRLVSILSTRQDLSRDARRRGGFMYSPDTRHANSWCTMFAMQALVFYNNRNSPSGPGMTEFFV